MAKIELSNEMVLDGIRQALYRQIPWHKRPDSFSALRSLGLVESAKPKAPIGAVNPVFDIAVITRRGRAEVGRLEYSARQPSWDRARYDGYTCDEFAWPDHGRILSEG